MQCCARKCVSVHVLVFLHFFLCPFAFFASILQCWLMFVCVRVFPLTWLCRGNIRHPECFICRWRATLVMSIHLPNKNLIEPFWYIVLLWCLMCSLHSFSLIFENDANDPDKSVFSHTEQCDDDMRTKWNAPDDKWKNISSKYNYPKWFGMFGCSS